MSRIDPRLLRSIPKHDDLSLRLLALIVDFETTIKFGEKPCYALRLKMVAEIGVDRKQLEECSTSLRDMVKYSEDPRVHIHTIHDPQISNHVGLIHWLNILSIALKLANAGKLPGQHEIPGEARATLECYQNLGYFAEGRKLIAELDSCRVDVRGYNGETNF